MRKIQALMLLVLAWPILWVGAVRAEEIDWYASGHVVPYSSVYPAQIQPIRQSCLGDTCRGVHAIIFVHGIFGSDNTFKNGSFDWRENLPSEINGSQLDVYSVNYDTQLTRWLGKDIPSLDEVVYALYFGIQTPVGGPPSFIDQRPYKSIGFIAHSLGGNIAIAYLHTVKTELGHDERSRHAYIITLGAPFTGAEIADFGVWLKEKLKMKRDHLLESLQRDNTFLRMLAHWRYSEHVKEQNFQCREVHLYAAREGADMYGVVPVVPELGQQDVFFDATERPPMTFKGVNHEYLAKPANKDDQIYKWVDEILSYEIKRVNDWSKSNRDGNRCKRIY